MSNPSKEAAAVNCLPPAPKKSAALTGIAAQLAPVQLLSPAPLTQAAPVPVYKIKVPRKAVKEVRLQDADLVLVLEGNDTHLIKNAARRYAAHKPFSLQFTDAKVAGGKFIDNLLQAMGNSQANIASDSSTAFSDLAVLPPALDGAAAGGSVPGTLVPVHIHTRNEANPDTVASAAANTEAGTATNASAAAWAEVAAPLPVATAAMPPQAAPSNDRPWGLLALLAALGLAAGSAKSGSGSGSGSDSGNGSNTNTPAS
ncbi:MAG: hypothetical protein ORN28_07455, partial [Rhodoferax sp.]|nr:hypothetical protein [Rhodoferax sp.]